MSILLFFTDTYVAPVGENQYADGTYGGGVYAQLAPSIGEPPPPDPIVILPRPAFKPPLDLHAEVATADGVRYRWSDASRDPSNVVANVSFASKRFEGFERGGGDLTRPIDRDWPDLNLYDTFSLIGYDASVAYEGRIQGLPRSSPLGISVETTGWMAHARDKKFSEVYVDADVSHWQPPGFNRRALLIGANAPMDSDYTAKAENGMIRWDGSSGKPIPLNSLAELIYTAPFGAKVKRIMYRSTEANGDSVEQSTLYSAHDDAITGSNAQGLAMDNTIGEMVLPQPRRYLMLRTRATATHTPATTVPYSKTFINLHVWGDTTVTPRATESGFDGVYASDVMRDIATRFCPQLDPSGIEDTTYPIRHLIFDDRTDPYDAWLELNKYHLWQQLAVWEARRLHYSAVDMGDYDWEVRLGDPGVKVDLQGDSTDHLANYAVIQFENVQTGQSETIGPDQYPELRDWSAENPANRHGLDVEFGKTLTSPTDPDSAAQIGRAALAENNQPIAPGTITFEGHLRDRAGHWQPGWKVRANQRVMISNFPNNRPRLIVEVQWDQAQKRGTIGVDATLARVDAGLDRTATALRAAGLAS